MKERVMNKITHRLLSSEYSIAKGLRTESSLIMLLAVYLQSKGAVLKSDVSNVEQHYRIKFPWWSFSSVWYSKDNFTGFNPIAIFGQVILLATNDAVRLVFKSPRIHYFGAYFFVVTTWASISNSNLWIFKMGLVFVLIIELAGLIMKRMLRLELENLWKREEGPGRVSGGGSGGRAGGRVSP